MDQDSEGQYEDQDEQQQEEEFQDDNDQGGEQDEQDEQDEQEGEDDQYEQYDENADQEYQQNGNDNDDAEDAEAYEEEDRDEMEQSQKSNQSFNYQQFESRKWQWATPLIEGVPPCPRGGHSATLSGASIVIFGGHYYAGKSKGYIYLNDTYVLDVNANRWHKPKISGTPPGSRYNHTSILAGQRIIIFGGKGEKSVFRDLHALDPVTMTWYQGPEGSGSPSARYAHSASLFGGSKMLIFGGWNGTEFFNDLYILDLEVMAWTQPSCTGPSPSPRQGHTAIQVGGNLIIQGGFCFEEDQFKLAYKTQGNTKHGTHLINCYLNDLRILDTDHFIWSRLRVSGTPPLPRYGHTSNITGSDIVVFGGWSTNSGARGEQNFVAQQDIDYFVVLNTEKMSWDKGKFEGTPPLNRYGHTSTSIGPHVLIFGGWEYNRATNEVVVLRDMNISGAIKKK